MHQSQPLHFFSLTIKTPVFSDWDRAFSGQAFTHAASSQNLHAKAKLKIGFIRMTRILDLNGFELASSFSRVQAYSQIPQPVHLLGSTEMNFLSVNFVVCISPLPSWFSYLNISVCSGRFGWWMLFFRKLGLYGCCMVPWSVVWTFLMPLVAE
jgi:hypothetical protein